MENFIDWLMNETDCPFEETCVLGMELIQAI